MIHEEIHLSKLNINQNEQQFRFYLALLNPHMQFRFYLTRMNE
jgi:hypothetical protein